MAPLDRDAKFQIRLTVDERQMLDVIADHDGFSASDAVRQMIRQRYNLVRQAIQQGHEEAKPKGYDQKTSGGTPLIKRTGKTPKR